MSHLSIIDLVNSEYVSIVVSDGDYIRWSINVLADEGYTHIEIDHESGEYILELKNEDLTTEYIGVRNANTFLIAFNNPLA